jgi:hypothetical protein
MNLKNISSENVATVRTTVNMTVLSALLAVLAKVFGWEVQVEDLLPYLPIFVPVIAAFYRLTRYLATKWTWLGVLLFGIDSPPSYDPPAPPLGPDVDIEPPKE